MGRDWRCRITRRVSSRRHSKRTRAPPVADGESAALPARSRVASTICAAICSHRPGRTHVLPHVQVLGSRHMVPPGSLELRPRCTCPTTTAPRARAARRTRPYCPGRHRSRLGQHARIIVPVATGCPSAPTRQRHTWRATRAWNRGGFIGSGCRRRANCGAVGGRARRPLPLGSGFVPPHFRATPDGGLLQVEA